MLRVTWEWIGIDEAALDLANTVAIVDGAPHDLLAPQGEYARWARAASASPALDPQAAASIVDEQARVLELRDPIRDVLEAAAGGKPVPKAALARLNRASRAAPGWPELGEDRVVREEATGSAVDRLLAAYARSAMQIASGGSGGLRVCGAPSCGMYYRPRRRQQRWCSEPCGTRARVARHYRARRR